MKCLLVSDLHYALKQFDWTLGMAPHFDVVIIAGDHLDISGHVDGRTQSIVILKYLRHLHEKVRWLIVSSGNHDLDSHDAAGEKVARWIGKVRELGAATDGDCVDADGMMFTVCPWWDGPVGRDAVGELLRRDAGKERKTWVWVYHAPPDASPTSIVGGRDQGDPDLRRWIAEFSPDIVLAGHIHESPFCKDGSWVDRIGSTWVFNAGRQIGPVPTHVMFDTEHMQALWHSLAGTEITRLDAPLQRPVPELTAWPEWLRS
ncbi:MAG: metallophosphoesterase [Defluviicoccus sp.]|nr:MAG: metallophosphoesterase [Defluviicoccus sp.]